MSKMAVKWLGTNALVFRHAGGCFMIDPYVSRSKERLIVPGEQEKYLTERPDFILMTHAHWDHLPDVPYLIRKFPDTILYASRTACCIMRSLGVPEKNLHVLSYGEKLDLPGGIHVTAIESRHLGLTGAPKGYSEPPDPAILTDFSAWLCGEIFAFNIQTSDGFRLFNIGSANLCEEAARGTVCDAFIGGISRWQPDFPDQIRRCLKFTRMYPVHHDIFWLPLSHFELRDHFIRLREAMPEIDGEDLPVMQYKEL